MVYTEIYRYIPRYTVYRPRYTGMYQYILVYPGIYHLDIYRALKSARLSPAPDALKKIKSPGKSPGKSRGLV